VFFPSEFSIDPLILFLIGLLILRVRRVRVRDKLRSYRRSRLPTQLGVAGFSTGFFMCATNFGPLLFAYLHTFERDTERYVGWALDGVPVRLHGAHRRDVGRETPRSVSALVRIDRRDFRFLRAPSRYVSAASGDRRTQVQRLVSAVLFVIALNILSETIPALFFP